MDIGLKKKLDSLYSTYNQRQFVNPDPLIFLYDYKDKKDREIVGLIAACLAYGRVEMILKTVARVLEKLSPSPHAYILSRTQKGMAQDFQGFRYRFANEDHLVHLLWGIRRVLDEFLSLENCFYQGWSPRDRTVLEGLAFLSNQICKDREVGHLLADPKKKSACKRSLLFLRWMIRQDAVDPGGWDKADPSQLIIPLDTHMYQAGLMLRFTLRRNADLTTALEITEGFRKISKNDPVKYDFCLTRFGIRREMSMDGLRQMVCC